MKLNKLKQCFVKITKKKPGNKTSGNALSQQYLKTFTLKHPHKFAKIFLKFVKLLGDLEVNWVSYK